MSRSREAAPDIIHGAAMRHYTHAAAFIAITSHFSGVSLFHSPNVFVFDRPDKRNCSPEAIEALRNPGES